jgi:hypothetical protein
MSRSTVLYALSLKILNGTLFARKMTSRVRKAVYVIIMLLRKKLLRKKMSLETIVEDKTNYS